MPIALRAAELEWLEKQGEKIEGSVLNVGSSNDEYDYRRFFPHADVYRNLDERKFPNVDILADVEQIPLPSNTEDCIVACFMLGEVSNPQSALNEFGRVLKPDGILLATFQAPGRDKGKQPPPQTRRFTKGETLSLLQNFQIEGFNEYFEEGELVCMFIRALNPLRSGD